MALDPSQAVPVGSVDEEYAVVAATPCACGGHQRVTRQALLSHEGRFYDQLEVVCTRCGQAGALMFDIGAFYPTEYTTQEND